MSDRPLDHERLTEFSSARAAQPVRLGEPQIRLLLAISDAARAEVDPDRVIAAAMEILRAHVGADRAAWAEVEADEDHFVLTGCTTAPGVMPVTGRFPVSAFGREALACMRAERPFVLMDASKTPDGADSAAYAATGIGALLAIPIHQVGRLVAGIALHALGPRPWKEEEVELAQLAAERIWEAVERARANRALVASEERLRLATGAAGMFSWETDLVSQTVRWSENAADLIGCRADELPTNMAGGLFFVDPEDAEGLNREFEKAQRTGKDKFAWAFLGRGRHWVAQGRILRDGNGRPVRVVGVTQDVTERKAMEEALRRNQATLQAFYDNAPVYMGVVELGVDDVLHLYDNPAACRFFGVRPGETAGKWALKELGADPTVVGAWSTQYRKAADQGAPVRFDMNVPTPDGPRWLSATVAPLDDGSGRPRFCYVSEDVTDRHRAEERVRFSEARFQAFMENTPAAAWVTDPNGVFEYVNKSYTRMFKLPQEDLTGRSVFDIYPAEIAAEYVQNMQTAVAAGAPLEATEPGVRPDGSTGTYLVYKFPLQEPGRPTRVGGVAVDISERVRAEQALAEADRRKDEYLALLAHELRNPLAPLRNGLQIMQLSPHDPATVEKARTMMDRQLSHMVRLVDDLLDVSRITRGKLQLRPERVRLSDVVAVAVETARPAIDAAGHHLSLALPAETVWLYADPTRIAQIVSNLLVNSAKYTDRGGRIDLSAEQADDEVVVTVKDTGIGIPPEALPHIFDMFSQVDRGVQRSHGGLGIGLALVRGLTELHGGNVSAESAGHGCGSTFTVRLPTRPFRAYSDQAARPEGARRAAPIGRILVVDDNRDSADSMAMMLQALGSEVQTAYDGLEAVRRAVAWKPDVILMDVGMPELNGLEATRRIRAEPWGRTVRIIALTGWGQEGDRRRSQEAGCDGHLVKPIRLEDLEQLVARLSAANAEQS